MEKKQAGGPSAPEAGLQRTYQEGVTTPGLPLLTCLVLSAT